MARAQRSDASRNRERLVEVAADAFAASGIDTSLERIAKDAGVGIGTLYRHFPTRDALVEAVFRHNVDVLCDGAEQLATTLPPDQALAEWMQRFVAYVPGKKGLATYLKSVVDADSDLFASTHARVAETIQSLMQAASDAGAIRPGVDGMDLLRGLSGVCMMAVPTGGAEHGATVATLLMDGLRYRAPAPADA